MGDKALPISHELPSAADLLRVELGGYPESETDVREVYLGIMAGLIEKYRFAFENIGTDDVPVLMTRYPYSCDKPGPMSGDRSVNNFMIYSSAGAFLLMIDCLTSRVSELVDELRPGGLLNERITGIVDFCSAAFDDSRVRNDELEGVGIVVRRMDLNLGTDKQTIRITNQYSNGLGYGEWLRMLPEGDVHVLIPSVSMSDVVGDL